MKNQRISTFKDFIGELKVTYTRTKLPTVQIRSSMDIEKVARSYFQYCMDDHEEFKVIHLNRNNNVVNVHNHTTGETSGVMYDVKLILQQALLIKTEAIIIVHNHPSGNLKPSQADIQVTQKLKNACDLIDISFLDSIILTSESYKSLADEGLF